MKMDGLMNFFHGIIQKINKRKEIFFLRHLGDGYKEVEG